MNFFDLPPDIIRNIYKYDPTYKQIYNLIIKEITLFPKFQFYDDIFGSYFFDLVPYKGVYITTTINDINYKKAFNRAFVKKVF
jgi:hypothetical protein